MSYVADKQANKQTVLNVLPTPTDIVGVSNYGSETILQRQLYTGSAMNAVGLVSELSVYFVSTIYKFS